MMLTIVQHIFKDSFKSVGTENLKLLTNKAWPKNHHIKKNVKSKITVLGISGSIGFD